MMLLGFVGLYPLLQYLDTPVEILPQSYQYISMIVTCVGISFAYNLFAGLLRSVGDSLAALGFFDFLCSCQCGSGSLFHYAIASGSSIRRTCYHHSQGLSAVLCFYYIRKSVPELLPQLKHFKWDKVLYADLLEQGFGHGL